MPFREPIYEKIVFFYWAKLFDCNFITGYTRDGLKCEDNDECLLGLHDCDLNQECHNHPGNYSCSCRAGYEKTDGKCQDINECSLEKCKSDSKCTNTMGSYTCVPYLSSFQFQASLFTGSKVISEGWSYSVIGSNMWQSSIYDSRKYDLGKFSSSKVLCFTTQ